MVMAKYGFNVLINCNNFRLMTLGFAARLKSVPHPASSCLCWSEGTQFYSNKKALIHQGFFVG
jgi:hypothetical protein